MNKIVPVLVVFASIVLAALTARADKPKVRFEKHQLDTKFRSEGASVADFNHDGKLDISAGRVYYAAPDWKMVVIDKPPLEYKPKQYSHAFISYADDVNGDGWADVIYNIFPGLATIWLENNRGSTGPWKRHVVVPVTNNESPWLADTDGDGKRELVAAVGSVPKRAGKPGHHMALLRPGDDPTKPWSIQVISAANAAGTSQFYHGLGVGDVNGDGRKDVLVPAGWWEAPAKKSDAEWAFHKVPLGGKCAHMYVYDFDGDGDQDVVSSSAHNYGIWWYEQVGDPKGAAGWKMHTIDKSYSQTHSMCMADINGDGLPDLITGKRWWAHGGNDPGGNDPPVLFWYELSRKGGRPVWTPHQIDHASGIGTQFEVVDVDGDKLLDIVIANKRGVFYFRQVRK